MPVPQGGGGHPQGMTTFDKMKMGAIMGSSVGLTIGFIFGGYTLLRHGPGPNGFIRSLGQYMLGSAATFGFFMSIGTAIRTEGPREGESRALWEAIAERQRRGHMPAMIVYPRRNREDQELVEEKDRS